MTPPTFRIGDLVKVVGQPYGLYTKPIGQKARITKIEPDSIGQLGYEVDGVWWYPASSLRLVEELKIGDWVEVIGPSTGCILYEKGECFQITRKHEFNKSYFGDDMADWYPAKSLRKLTPEEMQPIKVIPTVEDNVKRLDAHREAIDAINERLSAIEHRQGTQQNRMDAIEKRIDFIEAFQKHAAYTTYTYKPGEEGTITVHCSCGRKHEIEATPRTYQADSEASRKDEAELASLCPNGHQIPNGEPIRVAIERGDEAHTYCDTCPGECLNWSEKVLDDMRVD